MMVVKKVSRLDEGVRDMIIHPRLPMVTLLLHNNNIPLPLIQTVPIITIFRMEQQQPILNLLNRYIPNRIHVNVMYKTNKINPIEKRRNILLLPSPTIIPITTTIIIPVNDHLNYKQWIHHPKQQ